MRLEDYFVPIFWLHHVFFHSLPAEGRIVFAQVFAEQ